MRPLANALTSILRSVRCLAVSPSLGIDDVDQRNERCFRRRQYRSGADSGGDRSRAGDAHAVAAMATEMWMVVERFIVHRCRST